MAQQRRMLEPDIFKSIVKNTPLVSIDICLLHGGKILLGKRSNEPLKGKWFTPGGRIFKNESWQECILRVSQSELGFVIDDLSSFRLMGVWDHFYENSVMDNDMSTHYVNLPHYCILETRPSLSIDQQHNDLRWFDLDEVAGKNGFHEYMQSYASWLIEMGRDND
ncbi:GDP-mannose mannosyl hydrolase [Porticoccaceae bacterium nBUS_09]